MNSLSYILMPSEIRSTADLQAGSFHLIYCINLDMQWAEVADKLTVCLHFIIKMMSEK